MHRVILKFVAIACDIHPRTYEKQVITIEVGVLPTKYKNIVTDNI